jgi:hypothetical protein
MSQRFEADRAPVEVVGVIGVVELRYVDLMGCSGEVEFGRSRRKPGMRTWVDSTPTTTTRSSSSEYSFELEGLSCH